VQLEDFVSNVLREGMRPQDPDARLHMLLPELIRMRYSTGETIDLNATAQAALNRNLFGVESVHDVCHLIAFVELCADEAPPVQMVGL
jgi:hypothetical protein